MENKVNYICAINFMNQFHTPRDQEAKKIRQNLVIWGLQRFPIVFHSCVHLY